MKNKRECFCCGKKRDTRGCTLCGWDSCRACTIVFEMGLHSDVPVCDSCCEQVESDIRDKRAAIVRKARGK